MNDTTKQEQQDIEDALAADDAYESEAEDLAQAAEEKEIFGSGSTILKNSYRGRK